MGTCFLLSCAMVFLQGARANADTLNQVRPHPGSDNVTWVSVIQKKSAKHIRGPFWTSGLSVHRTAARAVWAVPGPTALGSTIGVGMIVDF